MRGEGAIAPRTSCSGDNVITPDHVWSRHELSLLEPSTATMCSASSCGCFQDISVTVSDSKSSRTDDVSAGQLFRELVGRRMCLTRHACSESASELESAERLPNSRVHHRKSVLKSAPLAAPQPACRSGSANSCASKAPRDDTQQRMQPCTDTRRLLQMASRVHPTDHVLLGILTKSRPRPLPPQQQQQQQLLPDPHDRILPQSHCPSRGPQTLDYPEKFKGLAVNHDRGLALKPGQPGIASTAPALSLLSQQLRSDSTIGAASKRRSSASIIQEPRNTIQGGVSRRPLVRSALSEKLRASSPHAAAARHPLDQHPACCLGGLTPTRPIQKGPRSPSEVSRKDPATQQTPLSYSEDWPKMFRGLSESQLAGTPPSLTKMLSYRHSYIKERPIPSAGSVTPPGQARFLSRSDPTSSSGSLNCSVTSSLVEQSLQGWLSASLPPWIGNSIATSNEQLPHECANEGNFPTADFAINSSGESQEPNIQVGSVSDYSFDDKF